jgi:integrase
MLVVMNDVGREDVVEWRLFFEFLTHTGLRIAEAIGLTWRHLDLDEAVTAHPSQVNAGSTEGPQTARNTRTAESADIAL